MTQPDYADVAVKPPLLFLGALVLGALLSATVPIGPRPDSANGLAVMVGVIFVVIGFAIAALAVRTFTRAGADVVPGRPATALVTGGPYRFTRNPIYIGFTLIYFGIAILATSVWILVLLVPVRGDQARLELRVLGLRMRAARVKAAPRRRVERARRTLSLIHI